MSKNEGNWRTLPMSGSLGDTPTAHWMPSPLCDPPERISAHCYRETPETSHSTVPVKSYHSNNVS